MRNFNPIFLSTITVPVNIVEEFAFSDKDYFRSAGKSILDIPRNYPVDNPYSVNALSAGFFTGISILVGSDASGRNDSDNASNSVIAHEIAHNADREIPKLLGNGLQKQSEDPAFRNAIMADLAHISPTDPLYNTLKLYHFKDKDSYFIHSTNPSQPSNDAFEESFAEYWSMINNNDYDGDAIHEGKFSSRGPLHNTYEYMKDLRNKIMFYMAMKKVYSNIPRIR